MHELSGGMQVSKCYRDTHKLGSSSRLDTWSAFALYMAQSVVQWILGWAENVIDRWELIGLTLDGVVLTDV